jgi:hypothetical protein
MIIINTDAILIIKKILRKIDFLKEASIFIAANIYTEISDTDKIIFSSS